MKATLPLPLLLSLILGGIGCSRTGDLSGDVFVVSGAKPTPAAGIEVRVIAASGEFQVELEKIVNDFDKEFAEATRTYEKERELIEQAEKNPATLRKVDELVKAELSKKRARVVRPESKETGLLERRLKEAEEVEGELVTRMKVRKRLGLPANSIPSRDALLDVKERHEKRTQELVRASEARVVLADINGGYEVRGLPAGPYYVSATIGWYAWLVPVQIVPGGQKVHLSNANAGWLVHLSNAANPEWLRQVSRNSP
jgi:hypothetical protein